MPCAVCKTTEELKAEFEAAKQPVEPGIVDRIMRGLPVLDEWKIPGLLNLRRAWVAYHERMPYA